jgi:hypothetical protein
MLKQQKAGRYFITFMAINYGFSLVLKALFRKNDARSLLGMSVEGTNCSHAERSRFYKQNDPKYSRNFNPTSYCVCSFEHSVKFVCAK